MKERSKFSQYLASLPVRIVMAAVVFLVVYGVREYWPHQQPTAAAYSKEEPDKSLPGRSVGLDSMFQAGTDAALDDQVKRPQAVKPDEPKFSF